MTRPTIRQREGLRKYRNKPTVLDGVRFDSGREARRSRLKGMWPSGQPKART